MATVQDIVDRARVLLNDPDKVTFTDNDLLKWAEEALFVLQNKRPDLFVGQLTSLPDTYTLGDDVPVSPRYIPALVDYVVGRSQLKDDEHVLRERAAAFFNLFSSQTTGVPR